MLIPKAMLQEVTNPGNSFFILDTVYDEKEELMMVYYSNGKIEEFYGVIKEMYEEFKASYFKEKYFYTYIKNVYDYYFVKH